jgi:DNA-binding XRE family transcriptional regulator
LSTRSPHSQTTVTGDEIFVWRQKMQWSQDKAAAELGVNRRTFQSYEYGRRSVPLSIWRCCRLLWLSSDEAQKNMTGPLRPDLLEWLKQYALAR